MVKSVSRIWHTWPGTGLKNVLNKKLKDYQSETHLPSNKGNFIAEKPNLQKNISNTKQKSISFSHKADIKNFELETKHQIIVTSVKSGGKNRNIKNLEQKLLKQKSINLITDNLIFKPKKKTESTTRSKFIKININTNRSFYIKDNIFEDLQKRGLEDDFRKALSVIDVNKKNNFSTTTGDFFKYCIIFNKKNGDIAKIDHLKIEYKNNNKPSMKAISACTAAKAWAPTNKLTEKFTKEKTADEVRFANVYETFQNASLFVENEDQLGVHVNEKEIIDYLEKFAKNYKGEVQIQNFTNLNYNIQHFYRGLLQIKHLREEKKLTNEMVKNSLKVGKNNLEKQRSKIGPEKYSENLRKIAEKNAMFAKFAELDPQAIDLFAQIFINRALEKQANNFPNLVFVNDKNEKISRFEAMKDFESNVTANNNFKGFDPAWDEDLVKLARDGRLSDTNLLGNAIDQEIIQTYNFLYNCSKNPEYPLSAELSNSNTVKKLKGHDRIYEFSTSHGERIFFKYPIGKNGNEIHDKVCILHVGGHTNTSRYSGHDVKESVLNEWDALRFDKDGNISSRS